MSSAHRTTGTGRGQPAVRSTLSGLAPEAKLVGLIAFLVVVAVTPPSQPWALAGQAVVAVGVAAAALVRPRDIVRRLVIDLPLVVLAATIAIAGSGPRVHVAGISLSRAGLQVGLALLAKATIGIVVVSAVAAATTASQTVSGLRRLRLPAWLCDLVALTVRQVQVLGDELGRVRLASSVRAGTRGRRGEWSSLARSLGVLFVRGIERADRLQIALAARGGTTVGALLTARTVSPVTTHAAAGTTAGTATAGAIAPFPAAGAATAGTTATRAATADSTTAAFPVAAFAAATPTAGAAATAPGPSPVTAAAAARSAAGSPRAGWLVALVPAAAAVAFRLVASG